MIPLALLTHRSPSPEQAPAQARAVDPPAHHSQHAQASSTLSRMARLPPQASNVPGEPYFCQAGYFKNKWIKAEIAEVQKGDRARKMAGEGGKDARQVDPPPVAQIRLLECHPDGSMAELAPAVVVAHALLVCSVALYPYNAEYDANPAAYPDGCPRPSPILPVGETSTTLAVEKQYPPALPSRPLRPLEPHAALKTQLEGARRVPTMFGAQTVEAQLCKHIGAAYFIFDDLKIRRTGHFMLKYSVFLIDNAFNRVPGTRIPMPCIAECWGGVFAVYPSRTAPRLLQSTDLTKHLNSCGLVSRARRTVRNSRSSRPAESSDDECDELQPSTSRRQHAPANPSGSAPTYASAPDVLPRHASPASTAASPSSSFSHAPSSPATSAPPASPLSSAGAKRTVRYDPVRDL